MGRDMNDVKNDSGPEAVAERINGAQTPKPEQKPPEPKPMPAPANEADDVLPLRRPQPAPEPFPLEALGEVLGRAAQRMRAVIQAPEALAGASVLAAASLAVQAQADVVIDGRRLPCSLFVVTIGESGERKSGVDAAALCAVDAYQRELSEAQAREIAEYENILAVWKLARDAALRPPGAGRKGESPRRVDRDAVRAELDALGPEPLPPLLPMIRAGDPTHEGLYKLLAAGRPSIGLFSDEGGQFVGGHAMNSDNALKTAAGLSKLWDGRPLDRVRGGDGASLLYGRRVALHLMMQPAVAELLLGNGLIEGQGFLARCLICWPNSTAGTRLYRAVDLSTDADLAAYSRQISERLRAALPLAEARRNELSPRDLRLSVDAKALWTEFHDDIETRLGPEGDLAPIKAFAAKLAEQAARIAGVLALFRDEHAVEIDLDTMQGGIRIADYFATERLRIGAAGRTDPEACLAEKLLDWMRATCERRKGARPETCALFHLAELYQGGPNAVRDAKTARRIVAVLVTHGYADALPEGAKLPDLQGREAHRREVWRLLARVGT